MARKFRTLNLELCLAIVLLIINIWVIGTYLGWSRFFAWTIIVLSQAWALITVVKLGVAWHEERNLEDKGD